MEEVSVANTKKTSREGNVSPMFNKLGNQNKIGHCHIWASSGVWLIWKKCNWGKLCPQIFKQLWIQSFYLSLNILAGTNWERASADEA